MKKTKNQNETQVDNQKPEINEDIKKELLNCQKEDIDTFNIDEIYNELITNKSNEQNNEKELIKNRIEEFELKLINFISSYENISNEIYEILFDRNNYEMKIIDDICSIIKINDTFNVNYLIKYIINCTNNYVNKNQIIETKSSPDNDIETAKTKKAKENAKLLRIVSFGLILETKLRKAKLYNELRDSMDNFKSSIDSIANYDQIKPFIAYLLILAKYASYDKGNDYKKTIHDLDKFFEKKDNTKESKENTKKSYDYIVVNYFNKYSGILNLYAEAIANYYENNLDERDSNLDEIKLGIEKINTAIDNEKKQSEHAYDKFYLTLGRLYALTGEYDKAIKNIHYAIDLVPHNNNRESTVKDYQQYLLLNTIIHSFDISNNRIKEIDKIKIDNIKALSILTAFLSFILGEITLFTKSDDVGVLCKMMVLYAFVILGLLGVSLTGIDMILPGKKNWKFIVLYFVLTVVSIIAVAVLYHRWK